MRYEIDESELLQFAKLLYEAGESGYSDLREMTCASMLCEFLADKKRITSLTNLTMNSVLTTTDVSGVYNIADRVSFE